MDSFYEAQLKEKNEWSDYLLLVDAAVMVKEEEDEIKKKEKTKSSSEQNHENLNGASTSSSILDLNQAPSDSTTRDEYRRFISSSETKNNPQNPPCSDEEEERAKKETSKIVSDSTTRDEYRRFISSSSFIQSSSKTKNPQNPPCSEPKGTSKIVSQELGKKKIVLDYVPRKKRSVLRNPEQNFENHNGASTSSSSSLFNLGRFESEKTETKGPPNTTYKSSPSLCLTESTSRKNREQRSGGKSKKEKVGPLPARMDRKVPEWINQVIRDMNGEEKPMFIFETGLSASDVNQGQCRLLIPFNKLIRNDFLTPEECGALAKVAPSKREKDNYGLGTVLVNQMSQKFGLRLKIYEMKKNYGLGTSNYALNYDWKYVVEKNNLKVDDIIRLWTFRCQGIRFFALETE